MARRPQVAVERRADGRWAIQTELVIKDERGKIIGKDSHGPDPRKIKG